MIAAEAGGVVEVQPAGSTEWQALASGRPLSVGDQLRTGAGAYVHLKLTDESSYILGPDSLATVEQMTPGTKDPTTTLFLQAGGALSVATLSRLGAGAFEIRTPRLTVSILASTSGAGRAGKLARPAYFPSGYVGSGTVTIEPGISPDQAKTQVGCISGKCAVTVAETGRLTTMDLNQYAEITVGDDTLKPVPAEQLAEMQKLGAYSIEQLSAMLTGTPPPPATARATATGTPPPATWTMMPTMPSATATVTPPAGVVHRAATPDPNWTPPFAGMTPEEAANAGQHVFAHTCRAYNKCICSESGDSPAITLAFDSGGVTLSGMGGGSITYPKAGPNQYTMNLQDRVATLTFFIDGWDFTVTQGGASCSLQTFMIVK
jgi:hypothetical protein